MGRGWPTPTESNGGVPVNIQDQHSRALDLYFIQSQNQTVLSASTSIEAKTITVSDTSGFVAGNCVGIFAGSNSFFFATQLGAPSGNTIFLDTPIDQVYPDGSTVITALRNMNVDGSSVTQIFQIGPIGMVAGIEIDITRFCGYIQSTTAMDDGKFGDLPALTNGIVLRQNNGTIQNLWNAKTNGDLALISAGDVNYTEKPPAGTSHGLRFRNSYGGQEKHGVTIRLEPGDIVELLIQDDLSGLEVFNKMAQGHFVTN